MVSSNFQEQFRDDSVSFHSFVRRSRVHFSEVITQRTYLLNCAKFVQTSHSQEIITIDKINCAFQTYHHFIPGSSYLRHIFIIDLLTLYVGDFFAIFRGLVLLRLLLVRLVGLVELVPRTVTVLLLLLELRGMRR